MRKIILFFYFAFFVIFINIAHGDSVPFPPYYFSADMKIYPEILDGERVRNYVTFDYPSDNTKFINNKAYTFDDGKALVENMGIPDIPEVIYPKFGFTLKGTNMRMTPSDAVLHKGNPKFDMNQYTRIGASSPLAVLHTSRDGKYYYVQTEFMRGWLPSSDIQFYDKKVFDEVIRLPFLRVLNDNINIGGIIYSMGDKVPIKNQRIMGYDIFLPDGREQFVFKSSRFNFNNEKFSPEKMVKIADVLLGNPYDWGGKEGFRDCSSFVRDLWLVFGRDLPRNTSLQSGVGREIIGKPASKEEFYNALSTAKPFKTLIFFKGHVILYAGMEKGDYIVYHSVNRLAKDSGETTNIASVVKQELMKENYSDIWKRVVKVTDIDEGDEKDETEQLNR